MRRSALCVPVTVALLLVGGCGGGDESSPSAASDEQSTSSPRTETPSASPSNVTSNENCTPPEHDTEYTNGAASFDVTAGPDKGHYDLQLDESLGGEYAASDKEITGRWISADEKAVLSIDIEGADPCSPDAFTSIGTRGVAGPVFIDSSHTLCTVAVSSLGDAGVEGTFTCTGLTGGGEGLERDAEGTFSLSP